MSERDTSRLTTVVRGISRVIGVLLLIWALSDDALIGGGPGFGFTQSVVASIGLLLMGSSFLRLSLNARILALVLSTGFVLLIGEIGVRILFSPRYQRPFQADEQLLYGLVPNSLREYRRPEINGGDRILYRINHDGFRGDELVPEPRMRIVVYGDSFIQGEFSALEETFVKRLEAHLSERLGFDVEVVNAGVAGYGPDQALRKMRRELPGLSPDLLIMAVFAGNDFGDMIRNKLYRVDDRLALTETAFTIDPEQQRGMRARNNELLLKRMLREAVHTLALRLNLRVAPTSEAARMSPTERLDYFRAQHVREYQEYIVEGDDVVRELAWDTYDADVSLTPNSDSARYKARLMDAMVGAMQALASSQSIPFVLIPIPHPIDVGGHDTGAVDVALYPDYQPRGLVAILEGIASRRDIPVIDLFTPFIEQGSGVVYFKGFDDHWNDVGQDLAAQLTSDFIVDNTLLGESGTEAPQPAGGRAR